MPTLNAGWLRVRAESTRPHTTDPTAAIDATAIDGTASDTTAIDTIAEALLAAGGASVEQQGSVLITYIREPADASAIERAIREHAGLADASLATVASLSITTDHVADEDWSREWRRGLDARRVGTRIIVTPTWIQPSASADDIVITIDPQMAFGTGEHATTRGMLRLMTDAVRAEDVVLDVGAGSAILSIAAVHLGAAHVLAIEADVDAMENALENIGRNGVSAETIFECAYVDDVWLDAHAAQFDLIVANVLSGVLRPLLPHFCTSLRPRGRLLLSGILREEAQSMIDAAASAGLALKREDREDEWWSGWLEPRPH